MRKRLISAIIGRKIAPNCRSLEQKPEDQLIVKRLSSLNEVVRTFGIALFVALTESIWILATSPSDSGQRGFGHGAVDTVCWLYLLWLGIAVIAVARNRDLPKHFWAVFVTNAAVSMLILAQFLDSLGRQPGVANSRSMRDNADFSNQE